MPNKNIESLRIKDPFLDKRIKLLPCQKYMVNWWFIQGESIGGISKRFKVSKRLVQFILFPERYEDNLKCREIRGGWEQYYNKKQHSEAVKKHRGYKNIF